ncbi:unnamed protein product, partial [Symbiodinium sp. CCMP2456]
VRQSAMEEVNLTVPCTLLEQARRQMRIDPVAEARVLVETLADHYGQHRVPRAHPANDPRPRLCLEELVPETPFQQQVRSLRDIVPAPPRIEEGYDSMNLDWLDDDLSVLLRQSSLPEQWSDYFKSMPKWHDTSRNEAPQRLLVYTDGSADMADSHDISPAAWAFAVWVQCAHGIYYLGSIPSWWTGVDAHYHAWVDRVWDSATAISTPKPRRQSQSYLTAETLQLVDERAAYRHYIKAEEVERVRRVKLACFAAFVHLRRGTAFGQAARATAHQWLSDVDKSIALALERIQELAVAEQIWLIGLQETRLPSSAQLADSDFMMLNAAADEAGCYGCALWINLQQGYATTADETYRVQPTQVVVVNSSPRHLQVHIEAPRLSMTVLVVHAPRVATAGREGVQAFWNDRERELRQRPQRANVVLLVDANSHVGSITSHHIKSKDAEEENVEGSIFHAFLERVDCALPATFEECHQGDSWTWCGPGTTPAKHRIDYIGIPKSWVDLGPRTWVWYTFEALQARQDHMPVSL